MLEKNNKLKFIGGLYISTGFVVGKYGLALYLANRDVHGPVEQ